MKLYHFFLATVLVVALVSCKTRTAASDSFAQGISGQVTLSDGNMMPGPGQREKKSNGVKREVYIYALANAHEVVGEAPLYTAVNTPLIAKVTTDSAGYYRCALKPGTYSLFTREKDGRLFSSLSNGNGEIGVAEIAAGRILTYNINVNYQAVY